MRGKGRSGQGLGSFNVGYIIPAYICHKQELTKLSQVTVTGDANFLGYRVVGYRSQNCTFGIRQELKRTFKLIVRTFIQQSFI